MTQVMKRIQLLLPEHLYERLMVEAHSRRVSMASVIREALASSFGMHRRPRGIEDFSFVGAGESEQGEARRGAGGSLRATFLEAATVSRDVKYSLTLSYRWLFLEHGVSLWDLCAPCL